MIKLIKQNLSKKIKFNRLSDQVKKQKIKQMYPNFKKTFAYKSNSLRFFKLKIKKLK
jgi:hypothetical protein